MHLFFSPVFLACFIIITGVVSEMVEVKRGDPFKLNLNPPLENISLLTVKKDRTDVLRYCSSEEKECGCNDLNSTRFSLKSGEIGAALTFPDSDKRDEGVYEVQLIHKNSSIINRTFNVTIIERQASKNHPTTTNFDQFIIGVLGVIGVIGVLILVAICICFIYQRCKKDGGNHNNHQAENEDCELGIPLRSDISAAPETPAVSIKMVDDNNRSERDLNHGA